MFSGVLNYSNSITLYLQGLKGQTEVTVGLVMHRGPLVACADHVIAVGINQDILIKCRDSTFFFQNICWGFSAFDFWQDR